MQALLAAPLVYKAADRPLCQTYLTSSMSRRYRVPERPDG
jgi:hypothetical protein